MSRRYNKIFIKSRKYRKGLSYDPLGYSTLDIENAFEAGYKQAAEEILSIYGSDKNVWNWLKAREKERILYIQKKYYKRQRTDKRYEKFNREQQ